MANFQTHLNGGIVVSGVAVLALHRLGLVQEREALGLFALGVAGSLLPDIDADASAPVRAFFGVLGIALAFALTLPLAGGLPPLTLALLWIGVLFSVRVALYEVFSRFTVHRGIWHSLLGVAFATLATVNAAFWLFEAPPPTAWAAGWMVGIGYLTHLSLDELYSVDLLNTRVRRSFGTALKPFSLSDPASSLAMAAAIAVLLWFAPDDGIPAGVAAAFGLPSAPIASVRDWADRWTEPIWRLLN